MTLVRIFSVKTSNGDGKLIVSPIRIGKQTETLDIKAVACSNVKTRRLSPLNSSANEQINSAVFTRCNRYLDRRRRPEDPTRCQFEDLLLQRQLRVAQIEIRENCNIEPKCRAFAALLH